MSKDNGVPKHKGLRAFEFHGLTFTREMPRDSIADCPFLWKN